MDFPVTVSRIVSAANSNNATVAKDNRAKLFRTTGLNAAASTRYLKFYDKLTSPAVGTDTPKLTVALPASTAFSIDFGGLIFSNGLSYALVTGSADSDNTSVTAADILGLNVIFN